MLARGNRAKIGRSVVVPIFSLSLLFLVGIIFSNSASSAQPASQPMHPRSQSNQENVLVAAPAGCVGQWNVVQSPSVPFSDFLFDVGAVSASNVWAVGVNYNTDGVQRTLVERWDGVQWSVVPSANRGSDNNVLNGVAAVSANDVWAVGYDNAGGSSRTLIERWNGAAWSIVPSPNFVHGNILIDVTAVSANDVWAVGYHSPSGPLSSSILVQHWNGTEWSIVTTPNIPGSTSDVLFDVSARAANDIWAVGTYTGSGGVPQTLILRWNGTQWSIVPSPNVGTMENRLLGVSVLSSTDAWAVGCLGPCTSAGPSQSLTQRWNGSTWSIVPSPSAPSGTVLSSVVAVSSNDVWAVGSILGGTSGANRSVIEHWDGSSWSIVPNPDPPDALYSGLAAVVALSSNDLWAVGNFVSNIEPGSQTLTKHYTNNCPTNTPTPTPTRTHTNTPVPTRTSTATVTGTPPTATSTVTPCPMNFTDVQTTDYFYDAVRYLYCAGVISGYSDGTFRPYNNTTRGQLTKIVVLGFGIPIYTPSIPTFTDVPITHTFYQFVETAAHEGLVSGYSDGTFRPGNDVTRGQLSKIVVIAAGWPLLDPPTPTFSDVPTGHTFYQYIETAFDRGIISGYADGTFRPGNNATRGQISKIVYNAIVLP